MEKICKYCGRVFIASGRELTCRDPKCQERKKNDTRKRANENRNRRVEKKPVLMYQIVCIVCRKTFISRNRERKYCDDRCMNKAYRMRRLYGWVPDPVPDPITTDLARRKAKAKTGIDIVLRECKKKGMTYSEWQKSKTIQQFARVEI